MRFRQNVKYCIRLANKKGQPSQGQPFLYSYIHIFILLYQLYQQEQCYYAETLSSHINNIVNIDMRHAVTNTIHVAQRNALEYCTKYQQLITQSCGLAMHPA